MKDQEAHSDRGAIDRRTMLRLTSGAAAGGAVFSGIASANRGNGNSGGKHEETTDDTVVFCGCSQICTCSCPVEVIIDGADNVMLERYSCYETDDGQIVAAEGQLSEDGTLWCNPNTACADYDSSDCDEIGASPQNGYQCGDAFLREHCD